MATYTTNFNLEKPEASDEFGDFRTSYNSNMDIIDQNLGGGGGSSTLAGLTDVSLTTPVTGDALIYDGAEWANTPLADVATSGDYTDLINTPSLATVATTGDYGDLLNTPSLATVATSGLYSDLSGTPNLATVATSGSYTDLSNKPTIPTALSDLTDDSTHRVVTDTQISTWNGKSDFSGSYNDLTDKPTIPTVNDGTLTIQQNGTTVGTFTANQSGNTTVNLTSGSSGHTIYDQSGTALADESGLQFVDARVTDDSVNSDTEIEIVHQLTKAQLNALGSNTDGIYETTDETDSLDASAITFNNSGTDLSSTDVEDAIKEVNGKIPDMSTGFYTHSAIGSVKNSATISTSSSYTYAFKYGKLVILNLRIQVPSISADTVVFTLNSGFRPINALGYIRAFYIWDSTTSGLFTIGATGDIQALSQYSSGKDLTIKAVFITS